MCTEESVPKSTLDTLPAHAGHFVPTQLRGQPCSSSVVVRGLQKKSSFIKSSHEGGRAGASWL